MKKPDWDRIHEIYDEARKLPRAERPAFVEKASAGDASIARDVLDLHPVELPVEQLLMGIAQAPFRDIIGECYARFLEELLDVALTNPKF